MMDDGRSVMGVDDDRLWAMVMGDRRSRRGSQPISRKMGT
jgi:hypothetical protein